MSNITVLNKDAVTERECPSCKYTVSQITVQYARGNFLCPSCKLHGIKDFKVASTENIKQIVRI